MFTLYKHNVFHFYTFFFSIFSRYQGDTSPNGDNYQIKVK